MPTSGDRADLVAWSKNFGRDLILVTDPMRRRRLTGVILGLVLGIGLVDYAIDNGDQISLHLFYFLPVSLAVITRGWKFAILIAASCVAVMLGGDILSGAHYASLFVPGWNVLITFGNYLIIIWLLHNLLILQREMEERVRQRTAALADEVSERERLEKEMMAIGQKERWSIGHDLHDGLCQHLTGTAFAARVLAEELADRHEPAAANAGRIVALIEDGIGQMRRVAKGLLLVSVEEGGLVTALQELAVTAGEQFQLKCECHCSGEPALPDAVTASHLFHIAQEAVRNAARHGQPGRISITLLAAPAGLTLTVSDDGTGIKNTGGPVRGMGLRIMAHRAAMIGADFSAGTAAGGGTKISCQLPPSAANL
ncbi:MAG TPA: ATP-binding protein [Opitutaceae bacterium]|jgi:signal transduction histidine kinase|nr:ATP-binding protein [Opitutaceae bacterium]